MEEIYLEDLCFDAEQAAEKAIKAVLVYHKVSFPYVHDLARLLTLVQQAGYTLPDRVRQAAKLTRYAVTTRYPGFAEVVGQEEHREAVSIAETVVRWADEVISDSPPLAAEVDSAEKFEE
jgi:HEPN domain-containing protein